MDTTPANTQLGFDTLKQFVHVGFGLEALLVDAASTSGLSAWKDIKDVMDILPEAKTAAEHYQDALATFEAMTDAQKTDLYVYVTSQMSLPAGKVQADVQKALQTAFKLYEIWMIWRPVAAAAPAEGGAA